MLLWVVIPPIAGWGFFRGIWIPRAAAGRPMREAAFSFARHLGGVYLYVYLAIVAGAILLTFLVRIAPASSQMIRLGVWLFMFGESFFVPAVMWLRLVQHDRSGAVFGPRRYGALAIWLMLFVVVPVFAMAKKFA
jgi:hypothetical protein